MTFENMRQSGLKTTQTQPEASWLVAHLISDLQELVGVRPEPVELGPAERGWGDQCKE